MDKIRLYAHKKKRQKQAFFKHHLFAFDNLQITTSPLNINSNNNNNMNNNNSNNNISTNNIAFLSVYCASPLCAGFAL